MCWLFCVEVGLGPGAWLAGPPRLAVAGSGLPCCSSRGELLASPSPLSAFADLPPPLPRDLGMALAAQLLWLGLRACSLALGLDGRGGRAWSWG